MKHCASGALISVVLGFLLAAQPAQAQSNAVPTLSKAPERPRALVRLTRHVRARLQLIEQYQSRSNFDGADVIGTYTILQPSVRIPYARWGEIDVSTRFDVKHFDFDGRSDLVSDSTKSGTPFDPLYAYRVRIGTNVRIGENTFLTLGGITRARWEQGADVGDAVRIGGFAGIGLQLHPRLFIATGAGAQKKLHGGSFAFGPIWDLRWQLTDNLRFQLRNFTYRFRLDVSRQLDVILFGRVFERTYQLRDRGGDRATRLEERSYPVLVRFEWRLPSRHRLGFQLGAFFDQSLRTNAGGRRQSIDQGTVLFAGVSLGLRK